MLPWPFQIRRVKHETEDTFTVELQPLGALEEFAFQPGQFNMVYVHGVVKFRFPSAAIRQIRVTLVPHNTRSRHCDESNGQNAARRHFGYSRSIWNTMACGSRNWNGCRFCCRHRTGTIATNVVRGCCSP